MAKITILFVGTNESPILPTLFNLQDLKLDIITNNILDFELPPLVENAAPIWHRHELRNVLNQINPEKFEISTSLKNLLKDNDRLETDDKYLGVTSHISQIEQNSKDLFIAYNLLLEQTGNENINLFPLVNENKQVIAIKNKKYAPLRYYQIEEKFLDTPLPESIDKKKAKEKQLYVSSQEMLKNLKLSEPALKSMQDSDLITIIPTDKISLGILLFSNELEKQIKNIQTPLVIVWPFDDNDEDNSTKVEREIAETLDFGLSLTEFGPELSFFTDYVILPKSKKEQLQELREQGCHVLLSDFLDDDGNVHEDLLTTLFRVSDLEVSLEHRKVSESQEESEETEEILDNLDEDVDVSEIPVEEESTKTGKKISQLSESPEEAGKEKTPKSVVESGTPENTGIESILEDLQQREGEIEEETRPVNANNSTPSTPSTSTVQNSLDDDIAEKEGNSSLAAPETATSEKVEEPDDFKVREEEDWIDTVKRAIEQSFEENNPKALNWLIEQSGNDSDREMQIAELSIAAWIESRSTPDRKRGAEIISTISKNNRETYIQILQRNLVQAVKENQEDKRRILIPLFSILRDVDITLSEQLIRGITVDLATLRDEDEISVIENAKLSVLQLVIHSRRLTRISIQELLNILDTRPNIGPEIWNILVAFDAGSIALELVTNFSISKAEEIIRRSSQLRFTGSYYDTISKVIDAWKEGDKNAISSTTGTILPEETLRKFERLELARKVDKLKMVQLSTLAESLGKDAETVERLITELIVNDELKAEMKLIDEKMYLVSLSQEAASNN